MSDEQTTVLDLALGYLSRGWSILPILPGTKEADGQALDTATEPLHRLWMTFTQVMPTQSEVRAWFDHSPEDGLALITGEISGVLILDADTAEGCAVVQAALGGADVPMVRTARGLHFYFRHPGFRVTNANFPLRAFGIDIRGDGAYAVMPPSKHETGVCYEWIQPLDVALPELPAVLLEMIKATANAEPEGEHPSGYDEYDDEDDEDAWWEDYHGDFDFDDDESDDFDDDEELPGEETVQPSGQSPTDDWDIAL